MRGEIKNFNPEQVHLESIMAIMSTEYFGKALSARIVGGRTKLERLIEDGKIECVKRSKSQNGKWYCKAAQVLAHCRDMRPKNNVKPKKQKQLWNLIAKSQQT